MDYTKLACTALKITPSKGTKGYKRVGNKWVPNRIDVAFGVVLPNGTTFNKSVLDPNSQLVSLLNAIRDLPMTRKEILQHVFGFRYVSSTLAVWLKYNLMTDEFESHWVNPLGWKTPWFSGIKRAGFVTVDKYNRFHLTGLGARVLRFHGFY